MSNHFWGIKAKCFSITCFLFFCLCVTTSVVQGQTLTTESQQAAEPWVSVEDAKSIMLSQIQAVNQQIGGFTEGTTLHDNALRRIAYFKAIIGEIDKGSTVPVSLDHALSAAATLGNTKEANYTSKIVLRALREETKMMLIN